MTTPMRLIALVWVCVAVLLRLYGIHGGDAAIVGGWLFLIWTAPFGVIWQFYLYEYALLWMPAPVSQIFGDTAVIGAGFMFWFVAIPRLRNLVSARGGRQDSK